MAETRWDKTAERPAFPSLEGDLQVDAAVVGAGIAGTVTAYLLKRAGLRVALLDQRRVGSGETGHTSAHLTAITDEPYHKLYQYVGHRAQQVYESQMTAIRLIETLAHECRIDCEFQRVNGYKFSPDRLHRHSLTKEMKKMAKVGIPFEEATVPLPHTLAFRFRDQAQFHPLKFVYGLAKCIHGDGSLVLEHTAVTSPREVSNQLKTPRGTIEADHIVYTTHSPVPEFLRIHTKLSPYQTYCVSFPYKGPLLDALYYDNLSPYHYIRTHAGRLIVGGADHPTGVTTNDPDEAYLHLADFVRQNIGACSIDERWTGEVFEPQDGMPYIGKRGPQHYIATGFSGTGLTFGALSGGILADLILGGENPYAELYRPNRKKGWSEFVRHNTKVGWHYVADRLRTHKVEDLAALAPGEGMVIRKNRRPIAVSKMEDGSLKCVAATCTHAAGIVQWNKADQTWDCPCHGSRFEVDGSVRSGPAARALPQLELEAPHLSQIGEEEEQEPRLGDDG
jgi:glycine/D-amino acid oxidase-like deaminating enzyme/nitrite reductase/ring-hydroxylating ferredoxin subunit